MKRIHILAALAALLLAAALSACSGSNLTLSGTVECTQYDVQAQVAGQIVKTQAKEGDAVTQGAVLAQVDDAAARTAVAQAQANVDARQAALDALKAGSRAEQVAQAQAAEQAAKAKYDDLKNGATPEQIKQAAAASRAAAAARDTAKKGWQFAKSKADDAKATYDAGTLSKDKLNDANWAADSAYGAYKAAAEQANQAAAAYAAAKAGPSDQAIAAAKAGWDQAKAALDLVKDGATDFDLRAAQANLDAAKAALDAANLTLARCQIVAPAAGLLAQWNIQQGSLISAGGFAAAVLDPNDLWMHLYVPQSKLKLVSVGQKLTLTTAAYPGETFEGTVETIASQAEFTPKNTQTEQGVENTVFKVKVRIADDGHKLRQGMTMQTTLPDGQVK